MRKKTLAVGMLIVGLAIALSPLVAMAGPQPSPQADSECNPKALILAQWMGEDVDCEDLMELQAAGVGFGVIMKAYSLSQVFDLDWEDLVERHVSEEGLGWGKLMKAYFLAQALDLDAEDLLELREDGLGWGQILKLHRSGKGKPPWARGGPPPWAGSHRESGGNGGTE
jgi:hypothetical protein